MLQTLTQMVGHLPELLQHGIDLQRLADGCSTRIADLVVPQAEGVQHGVGLEALADGRGAHVADVVELEAEGVQHGAELL